MRMLVKKLNTLEIYLIAAIFIVMVLAITLQILNRTFFKATMSWTEELARYCMVAIAMLGTEIGLRTGAQMSVTLFTDWMPLKAQHAIELFATMVNIVFCAVVCYSSITIIQIQLVSRQTSPAIGLPMWVPYLFVTFSLGAMGAVQAVKMIAQIKGFGSPPEASTPESVQEGG